MEDLKIKNPWLGLEAYKEGEVLYGRDDDIRDLSQSVLNDTDTLLYGKSGIGKSSILNAGIIPAARRHGFLSVLVRFSHKERQTYLQQIKDAIASAMIPVPLDESGNQVTLSTEEQWRRDLELKSRVVEVVGRKDVNKESLYEFFHRHTFHNAEGERIKLLIIFDQFEEIFTLQTDETSKKRFFAELADFLNDIMPTDLQHEVTPTAEPQKKKTVIGAGNFGNLFNDLKLGTENNLPEYITDNEIHLVFTIREDFLSEFEYYSASIPSLKQNRYCLRPINEEQASQIILRPIPGLIDESVARLIIENVTGRKDFKLDGIPEIEVDSAVLSLYLNRLYDAKVGDKITAELVEEKGGEIISDFYNDAISNISASTIEYLEDMLLNGQGRRDNITVFDAINDGGMTEEELEVLCNKKKILRQFNYAGDLRIEYVHDILCHVVKAHKDERLLIKQKEEERKRQEEEKQKILLEEKAKREKIEREAEEEKVRLKAEALRTRRRNRRKLYAIGSFVLVLLFIIVGYLWYYEWEHEAYYAQFERVNGWPVGVGEELSLEERHHTPLYYKLSHKGHLSHDTDVEICSSNGFLPLTPRIITFEVNENDVTDQKAMSYYEMLSKIAYIHFVEGENNKIDKEIALDSERNTLFVINYFHLPNGKEAWMQFVTATGQALKVRDNEIDRIKLSWYINNENPQDPNNGRVESLMYFDANGVCRPAANGVCGYFMKFIGKHTTMRYFMDEYGRATQTSYNVIMSRKANDSIEIKYAKASSLHDTLPPLAFGPKGYAKELTIGNVTYLYTEAKKHVATLKTTYDNRGNKIEERTEGVQPYPYPSVIKYSYSSSTGYLTGIEKYDSRGKPFCMATDSVYKKQWVFSDNGECTLEEHWNILNDRVYLHRVSEKGNVRKDEQIDKRRGLYLTRIDSILSDGRVTCYYGVNNKPVTNTIIEKEDTLTYHKSVSRQENNIKREYYYTLDSSHKIIPCPKIFNEYGKAISFFCKEECFDNDGNVIYYKLYDENNVVIKSMMRYYQNGQSVARAVMGVEGYGHPVRCPIWEEEGYGYYKLYYSKDFNDRYISINAVDEWENPSIFYDASYNTYLTITYKDYKGASISLNGEETEILYSYKQYSLDKAPNISDKSLPYLHILDKESSLYKKGLRDGDRIVRLGSWKTGTPYSLLADEWERMYKEGMEINVLHPSETGYEARAIRLENVKAGCEEYHIFSLTTTELQMLNTYYKGKQ